MKRSPVANGDPRWRIAARLVADLQCSGALEALR